MLAKLIGGPLDGKSLEVQSARVLVPRMASGPDEAIWTAETESPPAHINAFGDAQFGVGLEIVYHCYERGEDGNYHYKGRR